KERLAELRVQNKLLEAQRLESRTNFDIDMLLEVGRCTGIENYSRHLTGRAVGERPACLLDYFPDDYLCIIDESHQTLPQLGGMFEGDRSRKQTLVDYGFRLPSALDNRPLRIDEFMRLVPRILFVSATPGEEELKLSGGVVVEQIIRPTGLVDPQVEVRPVKGQVDDLLHEIRLREKKNERVLVTTLTKRMAEDLTDYLQQHGVRVRYLHSEIDAIERVEIIRGLRLGEFDVLVGSNLLREGLDLPEVSLVAILDADQEGFLRSDRSLIQTVGRAARHLEGRAILYADRVTGSMQRALDEMSRRRDVQLAYNEQHGITPRSIVKSVDQERFATRVADAQNRLGEALGRELAAPVVVGLSGELGTGKTTFVQAICRGLGARGLATSPTYALVHQYRTPEGRVVYHVDCYRLRSPAEAQDLGFDDMVRDGAIVLIEWPERAGPWTPPLDRHFHLAYVEAADLRELEELR